MAARATNHNKIGRDWDAESCVARDGRPISNERRADQLVTRPGKSKIERKNACHEESHRPLPG